MYPKQVIGASVYVGIDRWNLHLDLATDDGQQHYVDIPT